MSIYPKGDKFNDADLAAQLWPVYLENGTVEAVYQHCKSQDIKISKPTLHKMEDHFGWKEERQKAGMATFAGSVDQAGELASMLADLVVLKNNVQTALKNSPLDMKLHSAYGNYIGQILAIRKMMVDENKIDPDKILLHALKSVVNHLIEQDEKDAADSVGDNLEHIVQKIKETW